MIPNDNDVAQAKSLIEAVLNEITIDEYSKERKFK